MATNTQSHDTDTSTDPEAAKGRAADSSIVPGVMAVPSLREFAESVRDALDGYTAIQATGRWTPTTDEATVKTYESDVYQAAVMLDTPHPAARWQVYVETGGERTRLFEEPVHRRKAFDAAEAHMDAIAAQHGGHHASR